MAKNDFFCKILLLLVPQPKIKLSEAQNHMSVHQQNISKCNFPNCFMHLHYRSDISVLLFTTCEYYNFLIWIVLSPLYFVNFIFHESCLLIPSLINLIDINKIGKSGSALQVSFLKEDWGHSHIYYASLLRSNIDLKQYLIIQTALEVKQLLQCKFSHLLTLISASVRSNAAYSYSIGPYYYSAFDPSCSWVF